MPVKLSPVIFVNSMVYVIGLDKKIPVFRRKYGERLGNICQNLFDFQALKWVSMTSGVVFFDRGDFAKRGSRGGVWHGVPLENTLEKINMLKPKIWRFDSDDVPDFNCWVTFEVNQPLIFNGSSLTTTGPLHVHSSDLHLRQKSTRPPPSNDHHYGRPTSRGVWEVGPIPLVLLVPWKFESKKKNR